MDKNNSQACKICSKWFPSGKVIGGHMRSHFAKFPIPPNPETKNQALHNNSPQLLIHCPTQSASFSQTSHPQKKPTQNFQSLKRNVFAFLGNSNRENESGFYSKYTTLKRSKCQRKPNANVKMNVEPKQVSSNLDSFLVEEAARTLLILAEDKWPENKEKTKKQKMKETNEMEAKDHIENGRDGLVFQTQSQARFKCKRCGRTFQSYQALGGHSATHKKNENIYQKGSGDSSDGGNKISVVVVDQKVFECPCCSKVFKSARALGGHKKIHLSKTTIANAKTTANQYGVTLVVDLNFPALTEDEKDIHVEF